MAVPHDGGTDDKLSGLMEAAGAQVDELDTSTGEAPAAPAEPPSATPAATPEGEPPSPTEPATPPTSDARKPYDDFLAKHGGDPEKGAQHYFDVMGQNARLAREKQDLANRLKEVETQVQRAAPQQERAVSPPAPVEVPPEVQELANQVQVLSQNFVTVENQLAQAQTEDSRWAAHLEGLLNQLERASADPSIDEVRLRAAIADARVNKRGWQDFIGNLWRTRGALITEYRQVNREKAAWDRVTALERVRAQDETSVYEAQVADFRREWDSARQTASQKIPEKQRARFMEWAEKMGRAHVNTWDEARGDTKAIENTTTFADGLAQEYLDWLREASTDYAAQKTAQSAVAAPVGKRAVVPGEPQRKRAISLEELQAQHDAAWAAERI